MGKARGFLNEPIASLLLNIFGKEVLFSPGSNSFVSKAYRHKLVALGGRLAIALDRTAMHSGWYELTGRITSYKGHLANASVNIIGCDDAGAVVNRQLRPTHLRRNGEFRTQFHVNPDMVRIELVTTGLTGLIEADNFRIRRVLRALPAQIASLALSDIRFFARLGALPGAPPEHDVPLLGESPYLNRIELAIQREWNRYGEQPNSLGSAAEQRILFSVILPTFRTDGAHLCAAIESILSQSYGNWELCIADDDSQDPELYGILERYQDADSRVKFRRYPSQIGIAANSARAINFATGDYLVFVDADDELQSSALEMIAEEITRDAAPVMVYSDEDKINQQNRRERPYHKPSISPELLLGKNHVTHLTAYHAGHFRTLGGLDSKFDGAQDWEMVLRTIRSVDCPLEQIRHVPQVLYHWRISDHSTAQDVSAKPYAIAAGMRAACEHLESIQVRAEVSIHKTTLRNIIRFPPDESETISILIPTACQNELILKCINSILPGLKGRVFEIIVGIDHPFPVDSITEELRGLSEKLPLSLVHSERKEDQSFNYSMTMNRLAERAKHEFLILLNDDVYAKSDDWIDQLVGPLRIPNVAVSGAKLLYPNLTTQHNGVLLGVTGWAAHEYVGLPPDAPGYFDDALLLRNVSAVTAACLATRRSLFQALRGFDAVNFPVAFNDTDFCLRVQENGLRVVVNPQCQLIHDESSTREPDDSPARAHGFLREAKALRDRWADILDADPYYSPNLSLEQHHLYEELPMFEHFIARPMHPFRNFGTTP